MEISDENSTGSAGLDAINARLEAASTREERLAVLRGCMSEDQALHCIGLIEDEHQGDVIDRAQQS